MRSSEIVTSRLFLRRGTYVMKYVLIRSGYPNKLAIGRLKFLENKTQGKINFLRWPKWLTFHFHTTSQF